MTQSANPAAMSPAADLPEEGIVFNARRVTQAVVIIASAICFWMFWLAAGWVDFPVEYKHTGAVLFQHHGVLKLLVFWIVLIAATVVGTMLTSWRWFMAGLFSACVGGSAWAIRAGILRYVLFSASSPSVFLVLAIEQILLAGGVAILWLLLWRLQEMHAPQLLKLDPKTDDENPSGDFVYAIATQTLAMGIIVLLMAATDNAKQVNISVFIAGAGATPLAQSLQNKLQKLGKWYWVGPLLVGLIGYIGCYISPRGWDIGQPTGTFAPLARPLPLCYATFGMAGAMFGYWTMETVATAQAFTSFFGRPRAGHKTVPQHEQQTKPNS